MWSETTQPQYRRDGLRYASDVTDTEWALIESFVPAPKKLGRARTTRMREVVNALLYLLTTGCRWRLLPKEFPPFSTVPRFFYRWREAGLRQTINHALVMRVREAAGGEASPSAGVIDSQSVKTTESGGPRRYDAGKKVKGRKRHRLTDTNGVPLAAVVHPADIQDRDGAPWCWPRCAISIRGCGRFSPTVLIRVPNSIPPLTKSAGGHSRSSSSDAATGFVLLPRRWVVERTFARLNRNRRLAKDFEATLESALAWLFLASVKLLIRRLGRIPQPQIVVRVIL